MDSFEHGLVMMVNDIDGREKPMRQDTAERKRIELNRAIKTSGLHTVKVSLYREIAAELHLQVGKPAVEEVVEEAPEAEVAETEAAAE